MSVAPARPLRIVVAAAPFGYGPASRALLIARSLDDLAEVTILSSRDAQGFVERHRSARVRSRTGSFGKVYASASDLASADLFISVNNEPAIGHLVGCGLASRAVFVDSLLSWRTAHGESKFGEPIRAYLVQDFPGVEAGIDSCVAERVVLTAPMVWSRDGSGERDLERRAGVVLHLGGITSPLVGWEQVRAPIEALVRHVATLAHRHGRQLSVIGSHHLSALDIADLPGLHRCAEVSPPEAAELICSSELLLTTPGIGAIYEALVGSVPIVLLPPLNSTQLHQWAVFSACGWPGSISQQEGLKVHAAARQLEWSRQTSVCIQWLTARIESRLESVTALVDTLLDDRRDTERLAILEVQRSFLRRLSTVDAMQALRAIVLEASTASPSA